MIFQRHINCALRYIVMMDMYLSNLTLVYSVVAEILELGDFLGSGELGATSIGLVPIAHSKDLHPGWGPGSIGYHSDDGR